MGTRSRDRVASPYVTSDEARLRPVIQHNGGLCVYVVHRRATYFAHPEHLSSYLRPRIMYAISYADPLPLIVLEETITALA